MSSSPCGRPRVYDRNSSPPARLSPRRAPQLQKAFAVTLKPALRECRHSSESDTQYGHHPAGTTTTTFLCYQ